MKHAQRIHQLIAEALLPLRKDSGLAQSIFEIETELTRRVLNILSEPEIARKFSTWVDSTTVSFNGDRIRVELASIPRDEWEIEKINAMKESRAELFGLLRDLQLEVDRLTEVSPQLESINLRMIAERILLSHLENRPYSAIRSDRGQSLLPIPEQPLITQQNKPCEICGENRTSDKCHIIPNSLGGSWSAGNILILCPTHHRLYDSAKLFPEEWAKIIWHDKHHDSVIYAQKVLLPQLQIFWNKINSGNYSAPPEPVHDTFLSHVATQIIDALNAKTAIPHDELIGTFSDSSFTIARTMIKVMAKQKMAMIQQVDGKQIVLTRNRIALTEKILDELIYEWKLIEAHNPSPRSRKSR